MTSNFECFKQQLDDAVQLLENSDIVEKKAIALPNHVENLIDTQSLLARCESVCQQHEQSKPTIRIIHHFSCSGGSLLSECIAAMPNVYLLSEVHPYADCNSSFSSLDIVKSSMNAKIPLSRGLSEELFISNIKKIYQHVQQMGGELVIRDNAYFDYLYADTVTSKSIVSLLENEFNIISVVLYRDALDTYSSIAKEEFYGRVKLSFDEFCQRTTCFLNDYSTADLYEYEALQSRENETIRNISQSLKIKFNELYDLLKSELCFQQFDSWQGSDVDCYNSKFDTTPSIKVVGESKHFIELQKRVKKKNKKLILIASLPRSGSTWLFNCVCEMHKILEKEFYSCWIEDYDPSNETAIHIVKTHQPEHRLSVQADIIISTRRDVRDVVGSLMRMGWLTKDKVIKTVEHHINRLHPFWFDRSDLEINYPEIINSPNDVINSIGNCLGFDLSEVELNSVQLFLTNLSSPKTYDVETQLHPEHRANKVINYSELLGEDLNNTISKVAAEWLNKFGYLP